MADYRYQQRSVTQMPNLMHKLRNYQVNRSTLWRRQLKEKNPEKYRRYLDQQRVRSQVARNRLKNAISVVKNSPAKIMRIDRQKKMISEENCIELRTLQSTNLPTNDCSPEKIKESKILLNKLPHQIKVFKMFHILSSGVHLKYAQTFAQISVKYFWPTMREDVRKWVSDCKVCQNQSTKKIIVTPTDNSDSWQLTTSSDLNGNTGSWSTETTKILLKTVAEIFGKRSPYIQTELELWTEIAKTINLHDTNISAINCKLKWYELKKLYNHFKMDLKFSPDPSQFWPLYNIMDMIYKAFQSLTKETNIHPMFPFTSIFESTEATIDDLNGSNLISEPQLGTSSFPINLYRNTVHNSQLIQENRLSQVNPNPNLKSDDLCENNQMTNREQKSNYDTGRQFWNSDQIHTIAPESFELGPNIDNNMSSLILPLNSDFNAAVDVITASELQQEIKQECDSLIQTISFPSEQSSVDIDNSIYESNPPRHNVITFKIEPDENPEPLPVQTIPELSSEVLSIQNSSTHDLNTVDLTCLSPESDKDCITFSEDQAVKLSSSDVNNKSLSNSTTSNQSQRNICKSNEDEEELFFLKQAGSKNRGPSLCNPVSVETVSSNVIGDSTEGKEAIPIWFQQYMKEQKQHATEQEKRTKDFQDSLLGLVHEMNQHLATLINLQKNDIKEKEKDNEFKKALLNVFNERHK